LRTCPDLRPQNKLALSKRRLKKAIHANRNELAYITEEVADEKGNIIPNADIPVNFTITGTGELAAAGTIKLTANSKGLDSATEDIMVL